MADWCTVLARVLAHIDTVDLTFGEKEEQSVVYTVRLNERKQKQKNLSDNSEMNTDNVDGESHQYKIRLSGIDVAEELLAFAINQLEAAGQAIKLSGLVNIIAEGQGSKQFTCEFAIEDPFQAHARRKKVEKVS